MIQVEKKAIYVCTVCGQSYYHEDMILILDGEGCCRFCNQEGV